MDLWYGVHIRIFTGLAMTLSLVLPNVYAESDAKLHLDLVGGEIRESYNVTFSGILTTYDGTPIPHRTIFIEDDTAYTRSDIILAITKTDSNGKFLTYWKAVPKDNGHPFYFYALFIGGKTYGYSRSETYSSVIELFNQSSTEVIPSKTVPTWFKNASQLWHDGQIRDVDYSHAVGNLIDYQVIQTNHTLVSTHLPSWFRNVAGWLSDGKITNDEFVKSMQYLIGNQIIE